jgi:AbrB family looped-hinge helix DNA binding protein
MLASMDRAGRVVIPKEIRDRLSLEPDAALEVTVDGDAIRLAPVRSRSRAIVDVDGWPVIERVDSMTITDADVQRWRDADQR